MTKISFIVTADRHKPNDRTRLKPWYEANKKVVDIAKQLKVAGVLDAGDTGVDCRGSQEAQHCDAVSLIRPLAEAGIDYIAIDGNHDRRGSSETEVTINSWLGDVSQHIGALSPQMESRIHYWNNSNFISTKHGVQFIPLPYPPKHLFALGQDIKGGSEIKKVASEFLLEKLIRALKKISTTMPLVVLFHGTIDCPTLQLGGERTMPCGHEIHLPIEAFPAWDNLVVACGHIHVRQILSAKPFIFYPGNLVPAEHDNEDQEPGVMYIEFRDGKFFHSEFYPVKTVQFKTARIDLSTIPAEQYELEPVITEKIAAQYPEDVRVRTSLRVVLSNAQARVVDSAVLADKLLDLGFIDVSINKVKAEEKTLAEVKDQVNTELGVTHEDHLRAFIKRDSQTQAAIEAAGLKIEDVLAMDAQLKAEATNAN